MDISVLISFLSHVVSKNQKLEVVNETPAFCEKKIQNDLSKNVFSISNNCFEALRESKGSKTFENDFLVMVGHNNVIILKQTKDDNIPTLAVIGGINSKIHDVEFIYPLKNTDYFIVKNKNDDKLLIFNYKISGNINPIKTLAITKIKSIDKAMFNSKSGRIEVFDSNGFKEIFVFQGKDSI